MLRWTLPLAIAVLLAVPASAADQSVSAGPEFEFSPSEVTIDVGDKVTWEQSGFFPHNVKFDDGSFEEPADPTSTPWTAERTFDAAGTFRYYCEQHGGPDGAGMAGTVAVRDATGTVPPPVERPPGLTVSTRAERALRRLLNRGVRVETGCKNGCDAKLKLSLAPKTAARFGFAERRKTIGKLSTSPPPGEPLLDFVELTERAKNKLEGAQRGFKVRLDVSATNDGRTETAREKIKINP